MQVTGEPENIWLVLLRDVQLKRSAILWIRISHWWLLCNAHSMMLARIDFWRYIVASDASHTSGNEEQSRATYSRNAAKLWTWIVACSSTTLSPYTYDTVVSEIIQIHFRLYVGGDMFDTVYPAVIYPWNWIPAACHSEFMVAPISTCVFSQCWYGVIITRYTTCSMLL